MNVDNNHANRNDDSSANLSTRAVGHGLTRKQRRVKRLKNRAARRRSRRRAIIDGLRDGDTT